MTALKGGLYVRDFDGLLETLSYLLLLLLIVLLSGTCIALWYLYCSLVLVLLSGIYFCFILIGWGYLTSPTFLFCNEPI
jgi:hypothetical protein